MPRVPTLEPRVQYKTPEVTAPQVGHVPPEAFGMGVDEAQGQLAEKIGQLGKVLGDHAVLLATRDSEANALKLQTQFQTDLQNTLLDPSVDPESKVPKGYLNRQLEQVTPDTITQFDQDAQKLAEKYAAMPVSPNLKANLASTLNSHIGSARESVIQHVSQQRAKVASDALATFAGLAINGASTQPDEVALADVTASTLKNVGSMMAAQGKGKDEITLAQQVLGGKMAESYVKNMVEVNPAKALMALEVMQKQYGPLPSYGELKDKIEGKVILTQAQSAWSAIDTLPKINGETDLVAARKYVQGMKLTADRERTVMAYVHEHAGAQNAEVKQRKEAVEKSFTDQLVTDFGKVPLDVAHARAVMAGGTPTEIAARQEVATKLYTEGASKFDTWYSRQPQDIHSAVENAKLAIAGEYPTASDLGEIGGQKVSLQKAALDEFESSVIGKTAPQIRQISAEMLKEVKTTPRRFWFGFHHETGWKLTATARAESDMAIGQLEKDKPLLFAQARARVVRDNKPLTLGNIAAAMKKLSEGQ